MYGAKAGFVPHAVSWGFPTRPPCTRVKGSESVAPCMSAPASAQSPAGICRTCARRRQGMGACFSLTQVLTALLPHPPPLRTWATAILEFEGYEQEAHGQDSPYPVYQLWRGQACAAKLSSYHLAWQPNCAHLARERMYSEPQLLRSAGRFHFSCRGIKSQGRAEVDHPLWDA